MPQQELQGVSDPKLRRSLDAGNRFAEKIVYERFRPVGMTPSAGAVQERVVIAATNRDISGIKLVTAGLPALTGGLELPPDWITGKVAVEIYYTGTAGSTADIILLYNLAPIKLGAVVPAATTLETITTDGPATAGHPVLVTTTQLVTVDASAYEVGFKISRFNPDSYAGDVYILGVRPAWYPGRQ